MSIIKIDHYNFFGFFYVLLLFLLSFIAHSTEMLASFPDITLDILLFPTFFFFFTSEIIFQMH